MKLKLQTILKVAVTLAAFAIVVFALRGVDPARALRVLLAANLPLVLAALAAQATTIAISLTRWKYQLHPAQKVPIGTLVSPLLVSYAVGNTTPTGVGLVPRVYLLGRRTAIDSAFIAGTLIQEYVLDGLAVVLLAFLASFIVDLPPQFRQVQIVLLPALLALSLIVLGFWRRRSIAVDFLRRLGVWDRLIAFLPDWITKRLDAFENGLCAAFAQPLTLTAIALTTLAFWTVQALFFWLMLLSLGIPFTYLQASVVMAFVQIIIGIPAAPGSFGTQEAVAITSVLALGGDSASALAFAVLLRLFYLGPVTLVGAFLAWREGWRLTR